MQLFIFILAIVNNLLLTFVFIARKRKSLKLVSRLGAFYIALILPAAFLLIAFDLPQTHIIFLCIFIVYLALECLFDFILKIDFRSNWKLLVPYIALYYASAYGFIIMTWQYSLFQGIVIVVLTVLQITANIISHDKKKG